ncbi:NADPH-dependent F420 reductase [Promicromonospora vindobonensis]|uniref:NADPH-dependent F420 reductase n=1 Tax=Promicromonospora vindobonensis TaxID=195748 RepID=A0ABW5VKY0_9MICO
MNGFTIIGTGKMGSAIAALAERGGASVQSVAHGEHVDVFTGDVVVLAVPYEALGEVAARFSEQLAGKVVVDITNPVDLAEGRRREIKAGSAAAELTTRLPQSRVLKAFNTSFAATLASGELTADGAGSAPATVLVAGDDADAKSALLDVVEAAGAQGIDVGLLARARELEATGYLQLSLALGEAVPWTGGFTLVR